jgi:hypothetical protein
VDPSSKSACWSKNEISPNLPATVRNFYTEILTFEVVGFSGTYHAILERPAYAKFMAVPNYTYLNEDSRTERDHHSRANISARIRVRH